MPYEKQNTQWSGDQAAPEQHLGLVEKKLIKWKLCQQDLYLIYGNLNLGLFYNMGNWYDTL